MNHLYDVPYAYVLRRRCPSGHCEDTESNEKIISRSLLWLSLERGYFNIFEHLIENYQAVIDNSITHLVYGRSRNIINHFYTQASIYGWDELDLKERNVVYYMNFFHGSREYDAIFKYNELYKKYDILKPNQASTLRWTLRRYFFERDSSDT